MTGCGDLCSGMFQQLYTICDSCAADAHNNFAGPMSSAQLCSMLAFCQCHRWEFTSAPAAVNTVSAETSMNQSTMDCRGVAGCCKM